MYISSHNSAYLLEVVEFSAVCTHCAVKKTLLLLVQLATVLAFSQGLSGLLLDYLMVGVLSMSHYVKLSFFLYGG